MTLLIVPLTLSYLGKVEYGLWITLISIVNWIAIMDIGIGNGLRNLLTISLVEKNVLLSRKNISNAYLILFIISLILFFLIPLLGYLDLQTFFNIKIIESERLVSIVKIFFSALILIFFLNIINQIFNSFQKTGLANIAPFLYNFLFILSLYLFSSSFIHNLYNLVFAYSICMIVSYFLVTLVFFIFNKAYLPSIILFDKIICKNIIRLGLNFFLIQIAVLLIFSVDNLLILKLLGPEYATKYNIAYRIFSIPTFAFTIFITPFWSAFTQAYLLKDFNWIRERILFFVKMMVIVIFIVVCIIFSYDFIINLWLKKQNNSGLISPIAKISFGIFIVISIWNNIFSYFLNGIGKTKLQIMTACIGLVINIPLTYLFIKAFNMGIEGMLFSMAISLSVFAVAGPLHTYQILKTK
jgi:O-antigen/teichoic acid export membrane protein